MQARWILPRHRQFLKNSLNRSGAISVYRTVCWMFLGPEPTPPPGGDNRKELPHAAAKATETASPEATEATAASPRRIAGTLSRRRQHFMCFKPTVPPCGAIACVAHDVSQAGSKTRWRQS